MSLFRFSFLERYDFCDGLLDLVLVDAKQDVYFEKIRVFKAGLGLNTLAWNNRIGLEFYFVGFRNLGND